MAYLLGKSIFEKAKYIPVQLMLFNLIEVTELGLDRPWLGSRLRVKEEFRIVWTFRKYDDIDSRWKKYWVGC